MAAVTAAVVAGAAVAGGAVASAQEKKKGAEQASAAFKNVGKGIERTDRLERGISSLLGGDAALGEEGNRYNIAQDQSWQIVNDQMQGRLSEPTRALLGRRALETGATGLGRGAVQDAYTGYLGISTEQQVQTGFANYRAMFSQLAGLAERNMERNYAMQYNQAAQKANTAMTIADANAGMWQGIAQGVAIAAGGFGGGGGAGGGMGAAAGGGGWQSMLGSFGGGGNTMAGISNVFGAGGNQFGGPSSVPSGYVPRNVSERPPGL